MAKATTKKSGKKGAAAKAAPKKAASTKKSKAKAAPATKAKTKAKKSSSPDLTFSRRKAQSSEDVISSLSKSQYGRFLTVSTNNPSRTIRILDEMEDWEFYHRHWPQGGEKHACLGADYEAADGTRGCPTCNSGDQPQEVVFMRVMLIDEDGKGGRIYLYEPQKTVVQQLSAHLKRRGTLTDRDYTIERTGSGRTDTRYTVINEDKKARATEIKKAEKDDVDIDAELVGMWERHIRALNRASDDEDEDDEPATTSDKAAADLVDDDDDDDEADDLDTSDDDDEDEDEDDDEADSDEDEDEGDEEEADDESDDDDEDDEDLDDDDDDDDEDEEEADDDDDEEDDEDEDDEDEAVAKLSGVFTVTKLDKDEWTVDLVDGSDNEHKAVYYDEDEVDVKLLKKGKHIKITALRDDEGDLVIEELAASKSAPKKGKK